MSGNRGEMIAVEALLDEVRVGLAQVLAGVVIGAAEGHGQEGLLLGPLFHHVHIVEVMADGLVREDPANRSRRTAWPALLAISCWASSSMSLPPSARSSAPLATAPTGPTRSWQSREHINAAKFSWVRLLSLMFSLLIGLRINPVSGLAAWALPGPLRRHHSEAPRLGNLSTRADTRERPGKHAR